jgi:D-alanine-D-alanine ligase
MSTARLRVVALVHQHLIPPDTIEEGTDIISAPWRTEYDVISTLTGMGHEVKALGVHDDLGEIRRLVTEWKPQIAFNLLEGFDDVVIFDQNVVSHLELLKLPYTGCNSRGMLLARDKSLAKKLLSYHRIRVPEFEVFRAGRPVRRPKRLTFPLMVKSLTEEASIGISQASVVSDEAKLHERVQFIHDSIKTDAIIERYVEGRELYCAMLGNQRLQVFPVWEMTFAKMPEGQHRIATERVKWNAKYQEKFGIDTGAASSLDDAAQARVRHIARRTYRVLEQSGYSRVDLRLDAENRVYVLEANPNPQIARDEDFADSAQAAGLSYAALLQRILTTGLRWEPERMG